MPLRHALRSLAVAAVLAPAAAVAVTPTIVSTCGQTVAGRVALAADLDCSTTAGPAITLASGARLSLGGFTLTARDEGVRCQVGSCRISGPGTIRQGGTPDPNLPFGTQGVLALRGAKLLDGVVVDGFRLNFEALGAANMKGCTLQNGRYGVLGIPVKVVDSTLTGHTGPAVAGGERTPDGIRYHFGAVTIRGSTLTGNFLDVAAYRRPRVVDTVCTSSFIRTIPFQPFDGSNDDWNVCP
jgi:hypothetical protein